MLLKRQNKLKPSLLFFVFLKSLKLFVLVHKKLANIQNIPNNKYTKCMFSYTLGTNKIKVLVSKRKTLCLVSPFARNIGTNLFQSGTYCLCVKLAATFDAPLCLFEA
jgi:hypothetical protein